MCPACPRVAGGVRAERWKFSRSLSSAPRDARPPMPSSPITAAAVAITERDGRQYGLAALGAIVGMERSHLWHAALADNLRRRGRTAEAAGELETAAALAPTEGERRLLLSRLLDVRSGPADRFQGCRCP